MAVGSILTNVYFWMIITFVLLIFVLLLFILIIFIGKKTHAIIEFKAWMKGRPIGMFFNDTKYCDWKPVKPEGGMIVDKEYGAFIISSTYVDKTTKNILIPFQADFAGSVDIKAAKLADDLSYIIKDNVQLKLLREGIARNNIQDSESINTIKTSINFGAIKSMMMAMTPHGIDAKINMMIAKKLKSYGSVNGMQALTFFGAMLGAILMGYMIIRLATPG